ncbi:MAG TPA: hypothetical protein DG753_13300 [Clostridium sp.]|nr:hypothetical protein [Clostridium sp.]
MDLDKENIEKNSFEKEFEFQTENKISVKSFNIDRDFSYLNLKLKSDYDKNPVVYIMLIDSNNKLRIQYRSIYSKNNIIVGQDSNKCSIGTYPGPINNGEWKLIIISLEKNKEYDEYSVVIECTNNKIENQDFDKLSEDVWVDYNNEDNNLLKLTNYDWDKNFNSEKRWYKGDFHTHSIISDGKMDNKLYMKVAKEMNLDFAVPTEHNIIPTACEKDNDVLIIPGTEITMIDGHFNILGIRKFPLNLDTETLLEDYHKKDFHDLQESIVKKIIYDEHDNRAIYSINHMVLEFWKWKFLNVELEQFDTIEICNDPTYYLGAESNDKVLKMLDILWNDGHKIYGIGGSDAHILPTETYDNSSERSIMGDPGTFVYCDKLTANNVIESIQQGHVYVSRGILLYIDIKVKGRDFAYLPGDEIEINDQVEINYSINIKLENLVNEYGEINKTEMPLKVYFIENGIKTQKIISKEGPINFNSNWSKDDFKYLSVEIRDMQDNFKAYINPIYHGSKKHEIITFEDLFTKYTFE